MQGMGNVQDARREMTKTKEQLEEEKKISLSIRIKPLELDGMDGDALKEKASELWEVTIIYSNYLNFLQSSWAQSLSIIIIIFFIRWLWGLRLRSMTWKRGKRGRTTTWVPFSIVYILDYNLSTIIYILDSRLCRKYHYQDFVASTTNLTRK